MDRLALDLDVALSIEKKIARRADVKPCAAAAGLKMHDVCPALPAGQQDALAAAADDALEDQLVLCVHLDDFAAAPADEADLVAGGGAPALGIMGVVVDGNGVLADGSGDDDPDKSMQGRQINGFYLLAKQVLITKMPYYLPEKQEGGEKHKSQQGEDEQEAG